MNSKTILLRQIHPIWIQQGRVTSQAFRPTPKDENKLSVFDWRSNQSRRIMEIFYRRITSSINWGIGNNSK